MRSLRIHPHNTLSAPNSISHIQYHFSHGKMLRAYICTEYIWIFVSSCYLVCSPIPHKTQRWQFNSQIYTDRKSQMLLCYDNISPTHIRFAWLSLCIRRVYMCVRAQYSLFHFTSLLSFCNRIGWRRKGTRVWLCATQKNIWNKICMSTVHEHYIIIF